MSETEKKLSQLSMFEQGMQTIVQQKQQFQSQLVETQSALEELGKTDEAYNMVGSIMVKANKNELKQDLEKRQEMLTLRLKTLEKQETQLRDKATKLQEQVVTDMKGK